MFTHSGYEAPPRLQAAPPITNGHRTAQLVGQRHDRFTRHVSKDWIFKPAQRNGLPVRAWATVPIEFKLID